MNKLVLKRGVLVKQLVECSTLVRGSISSVCAQCNRAKCICAKKTPKKAYRLTYKDRRQKTQTVYVPQSQLSKIRKMIGYYAKLRKVVDQLVETNLAIFKQKEEG